MNEKAKADMFYLRADGWCQCGRSRNTSEDTFEDGISVYECEDVGGGKWKGKGPAFAKRERLLSNQSRSKFGGTVPWYLVTGEVVGTGGDQEPLLRGAVQRKLVTWDGADYFVVVSDVNTQIWANHPGYPDCDCETLDDLLKKT